MKKVGIWRGLGITFLTLLILLLVGPFLIPVPDLEGTKPASELADPDSQFIEINGLVVHARVLGEGEPAIVLLHGFGASLYSWHAVMESLSERGMVVAYDRPAFGLTERPMDWDGLNPYSMEANVDLLLELLDQLHIPQAVLIGNSAGGSTAMEFTLAHPERVSALILVDPAVYGSGGPKWVRTLGKTPQVQHLGPLLVRSIQSRGLETIQLAWHDPTRITQETLDGYTRPLQVDNWDQALWQFTMAASSSSLPDRLTEFDLPVLVITGDDDRIVPTEASIRLAEEMPGAKLVVIASAGHVPHEEQPQAFVQAVENFLDALP